MLIASFALSFTAAALVVSAALAQEAVIGPGREAVFIALAEPYTLGGEVTPGWTLQSIQIDRRVVRFQLRSTSGVGATLTLHHPQHAPENARPLRSFGLTEEGGAESLAARTALRRALHANDRAAAVWETTALPTDDRAAPVWETTDDVESQPPVRESPLGPVILAAVAFAVCALGLVPRRRRKRPAVDPAAVPAERS